jgi:hypothetical protein
MEMLSSEGFKPTKGDQPHVPAWERPSNENISIQCCAVSAAKWSTRTGASCRLRRTIDGLFIALSYRPKV